MVKRINISLPDNIADRLERFKSRLNVSQVCAAALDREIRMLEAVKVQSIALQEMVGRLRAERKQSGDESRQAGFEDGARWAIGKAEYQLLKMLASKPNWEELSQAEPGLWDDIMDEMKLGEHERTYVDGFIQGVLDVWHQVEGQVETD